MRRKTAVWATSLHWRSASQVSAHHYARLLVKQGWDVAFVSHPISPWHLLRGVAGSKSKERWRSWWRGGEVDLEGHLVYYTPFTLCPPHNWALLSRPEAIDWWPRLTFPNLDRFLRRRGFGTPDLLVIDSPLHASLLATLPTRRTVLRIVDDLGGFPGAAPSWVEREKELVPQVDHVIVTARALEEQVLSYHPRRLTHVPNGVEIERFLNCDPLSPEEYRTIPEPRAVYVGAIDEWFDVDLLVQVARRLPEVSFVLIGDGRANLQSLAELGNVHILGRRAYGLVPAYLKHAAVGLIPFKRNRLTRAVNPIKLYEYLACGLPVVATAWEELQSLKSPALLCNDAAEFQHAIQGVLEQPPERLPLLGFARQADWTMRAQALFAAIGVA
ncbi:hypothetical protein AYO44_08820 [Planctomycetaceae bacterium SCGC AG-212-F19]|nr:hypothetical protein AYO44_08820 [Planctomycetaceae bacterium SCGC AG-212-F19]